MWLVLAVAVAGCETPEADSSPPFVVPIVSLPAWSGAHAVGHRSDVWVDEARGRALAIDIYYPGIGTDTARHVVLQDSLWAVLHRNELSRRLGPAAAQGMIARRSAATIDARVEPWDSRFPVLLFAPTAGWLPSDYAALLEGIASHGFVVIAFAPPGDGGLIKYPDGTIVETRLPDDATPRRLADDLLFLRRRLWALESDSTFALRGRFDPSAVGVIGHAIGGGAAFRAAARDTTITAAANLDGDITLAAPMDQLRQPVLYATTEPTSLRRAAADDWSDDRVERRRNEAWAGVIATSRAPTRIRLSGMYQWNFLDAALMPRASISAERRRHRFGTIDGARGLLLAGDLTAQFFSDVFMGTRVGLDAVRSLYPEIWFVPSGAVAAR